MVSTLRRPFLRGKMGASKAAVLGKPGRGRFPGGLLPPLYIIDEHTVPSGGATSHTFSGIDTLTTGLPFTALHLVALIYGASEDAVVRRRVDTTFNGDTGANYNFQGMEGVNATATAARFDAEAFIRGSSYVPGTTYASAFGGGFILVPDAFNTARHKHTLSVGGAVEESSDMSVGRWASTAAITSWKLESDTGDFAENTHFILCVVDERYNLDGTILSSNGKVTFDNISQKYGDLVVVGSIRTDRNAEHNTVDYRINDDATTTNYHSEALQGDDAVMSASSQNNDLFCVSIGNISTGNVYAPVLALFANYADPTNDPSFISVSGSHSSTGPLGRVFVTSGRRNNVDAITKLYFYPTAGVNLRSGTGMWLYYKPKQQVMRHALSSDASSVTFNVPSGYDAFTVTAYARTDRANVSDDIDVSFNGDVTEANYDRQYLEGNTSTVTAARSASSRAWMNATGDSEGANEFGVSTLTVVDYNSTVGHKHGHAVTGRTDQFARTVSGRWESTAAIQTIALTPDQGSNFLAGSVFELSIEGDSPRPDLG